MMNINVLGLSNLHSIRLTVAQVCEIAGFGERTFFSRKKSGKLKVCHDPNNRIKDGRPRIFVYADDLAAYLMPGVNDEAGARERMGLPAIEGEQEPTPEDRKIFADVEAPYMPRRVPDIGEPDAFRPREYHGFSENSAANQAAWQAGEVTDTMGNSVHGNERWPNKGSVSLIGPQEPRPKERFDCAAHMDKALVGGLSDERYAEELDKWRKGRYSHTTSLAEQFEAQERSQALMREAFNFAKRPR
jgi:hypothetical protein